GSLLLPSYAASPASSSGSGYSPPSTVASRATTSYDVRAPGRVRQAGCYPWPNAPHSSSSSSTVESSGGGRRVLSSAVAAGPTKSRGRRMFQVQEEMNRAERKATAAAAAAAAVAASASPSGSPASLAVTAAAKCSPEQQRRLERQQQQRRQQEGVRPRSSTGGGSPLAAAAAAVEASAPPPDSTLTPPVSSSAAAVVSASTTSQTHLAPPSSSQQQQQEQQKQQLRGGRGEDEPPSRPAAMTTAAATVVVEIDEQLPRPRPGPTAERPPSRPTERDATGSTDSTGSSRASPHADDCAGGGGDWAGTGREADGRPELRYREYAAGVSITSPPARTAPVKEEEEAADVVGPASALEVSSNEAYPSAPSGATPPAGGSGSKEGNPPAAAAIRRASDSTAAAAAASPARVEAGGTADNTCKNVEDASDDLAAGSPLTAAAEVPSGIDSIEPSGSQEHSRRVAPESKSTWTSPKCVAEIGNVALGTTPCRSQHVPPVVTPPPDDQLGRTSASQDAASDGSDREDAIGDNDQASACRSSGGVDAADGGRMGDGGSNKRGGGANTVGSRGRHKRARIDKQQGNHAGSGECGESTGGVAAPSGVVCSSPPANRQRHPVLVDASPPSTAPTASPSPCGGTTAEPCLGHDEDGGGGGGPHGDGSSLSPSSPPLLPTLPPQRQEQEPEIEFQACRLLPAAAAIPKVPSADKADAAPPGAEPTEIVAEEEEGKGEPICASSSEVEGNRRAAALPSPVRAAEVVAVAQRSANGKHGEARPVASGRGRLPARFVGSSGAAAAAVAGGGGDDTKGRHKRLKRPSRKMLEVRERKEEEEEGVVKQRPPPSASCAPAAAGVTLGTAVAATSANSASFPSRAAGTPESSRGGENPTAATAAAATAAAVVEVVSAVEVGPKKKRRKRSKSTRGLPATPTPRTAGGAVDPSPPAEKAVRSQAKGGSRRRKKDGGGGGASRSGGKSQGTTTASKHRMREAHAHLLRKGAVVPRSAQDPSAAPLAKPGRRMVPSPARTRSSSVAAPPAATGKVATARVKTAEVRSNREESPGRAGVANGDVPAPAPAAASSWTGWMAPRSSRQPPFLPSQQPAVSVGRGGSR
ncbi:unnamed protein product, partial [Ectocarpus sp. 8 AP-2014]